MYCVLDISNVSTTYVHLNDRTPTTDIYKPSPQEGPTEPLRFNISIYLLFHTYMLVQCLYKKPNIYNFYTFLFLRLLCSVILYNNIREVTRTKSYTYSCGCFAFILVTA